MKKKHTDVHKRSIHAALLWVIFCLTACGGTEDSVSETEGAKQAVNEAMQENTGDAVSAEPIKEEESPKENPEDAGEEGQSAKKMENRSVSIVGDSISTFKDYIPYGYYDFFPEHGEVKEVAGTWWKPVFDEFSMTLYTNDSSAGSTCVGDSTGMENPQCGCNELRTSGLSGPRGAQPDVIIVYMGTNDFLNGVPLGNNDGTAMVEEGKIENFSDAYTLMLDKLQANYPIATVYCCTLTQIGYINGEFYVDFENGAGLTTSDYNECIKQIADKKGCFVVDLEDCGITADNMAETTSDGVHPTLEGMQYIAAAVKEALE